MQQRTIILTVVEDTKINRVYITNSEPRIGYAGEHQATLIRFDLPETWLAEQDAKYQIYFLTADGKRYTTDLLDTPEFSPPSAVMIEGRLYMQVLSTDSAGTVIKKTEVCKCEVGKSISDAENILDDEGVHLISAAADGLQSVIDDANAAADELMAKISDAAQAHDNLKNITALNSIVVFDANSIPIFMRDVTATSGGFAAGLTNAKTVFIPSKVTAINGGSFIGCNNLTDVYINNTATNINISSGVFGTTVAIHYKDSAEFAAWSVLDCVMNALKNINIPALQTTVDDNSANIADLQAYVGYTGNDIVGLHVDYENKKFTRLAGAVGKTSGSDYDSYPMYGGRRRCNVADDGTINAYYGDDNYTEDGTNGQVMVYQPAFYYKVVPLIYDENKETGIGYHLRKANYYITSRPHNGFKLHPAFYDVNGDSVPYIFYSAYEGSYYDASAANIISDDTNSSTDMDMNADKICSIANVKPISGLHKNLTRTNFEKLASNRGAGWHCDTIKSISANQLLMMIEFGTMNTQSAVGQGVVSITDNTSYNCASLTGSTAELGNATGQAAETINRQGGTSTTYTDSGKVSVSYRGVENPWGNIWKFVVGVNIWGNGKMGGGQPYVADDFNFVESKISDNYKPVGFTLANSAGYINAMGYGGEEYDWLMMPSEVGGTSALPVGDMLITAVANLDRYSPWRIGGHCSASSPSGGFCCAESTAVNASGRNINSRLLYIPTAVV